MLVGRPRIMALQLPSNKVKYSFCSTNCEVGRRRGGLIPAALVFVGEGKITLVSVGDREKDRVGEHIFHSKGKFGEDFKGKADKHCSSQSHKLDSYRVAVIRIESAT